MNLAEQVRSEYLRRFKSEPDFVAHAPGRVNLLGEHVDYNDGFVLPAAIDRATWIAFSPSSSDITTLLAADLDEQVSFLPKDLAARTDADGAVLPEWSQYPAGVLWALTEAGHAAPGMRAVFASDVPRGAGLSSSAALELAFGVAWQRLGNWTKFSTVAPLKR